uniref:F-box domain-containing protein n=1 Tax=Leersia perrieri TaxID=77586 RepID=A0A0D9X975_9ORYZ
MKRKREDDAAAAADSDITTDAAANRAGSLPSSDGAICDDVVRHIFARLPARDAVASMALSKHHRRLISSPEFRRLHCRHGEPLLRPHISYVAMAPVVTCLDVSGRVTSLEFWAKRRAEQRGFGLGAFDMESGFYPGPDFSSRYHGFHVAGNGRRRRQKYNDHNYVGTCNGVILLAGNGKGEEDEKEPSVGLLLNPAISDDMREVFLVGYSQEKKTESYHILGFGYGPRTGTYKLILCKQIRVPNPERRDGGKGRYSGVPSYVWRDEELMVYSLGAAAAEQPRTVFAGLDDDTVNSRSVYMDGTVFLLNVDKAMVLAFDVDGETITTIDLPGNRVAGHKNVKSDLMEVSGRVCVATKTTSVSRVCDLDDDVHEALDPDDDDGGDIDIDKDLISVWLLTADHRRSERRCAFHSDSPWSTVAGVWDCGSVLLIVMKSYDKISIFLYDDATKVSRLKALPNVSPNRLDYNICWGYKPTLVTPASIVGELSEDE